MEIVKGSLDSLDLKKSIVDSKLLTTVYSKPTDSHFYLQPNSCHNAKAIDGIQKIAALKLQEFCHQNKTIWKHGKNIWHT